jgi:hypothetical protein
VHAQDLASAGMFHPCRSGRPQPSRTRRSLRPTRWTRSNPTVWPWASASTRAAPPPRPHCPSPPTRCTRQPPGDPVTLFAANFRTLPKIRAALVALAHGSPVSDCRAPSYCNPPVRPRARLLLSGTAENPHSAASNRMASRFTCSTRVSAFPCAYRRNHEPSPQPRHHHFNLSTHGVFPSP